MLNLTDCVVTFCITLLVTTSSLFLPPVEGPMKAFAHGISTAMLSGIGGAMFVMCCMTASALFYRGAMGGKKERQTFGSLRPDTEAQELRIFNLGRVANSTKLAAKVKERMSSTRNGFLTGLPRPRSAGEVKFELCARRTWPLSSKRSTAAI